MMWTKLGCAPIIPNRSLGTVLSYEGLPQGNRIKNMLPHNLLCSAQRARPNYGRVLLRAACAASITGVFCFAQRARPQLRACFAPRSVRGLNYGRVLLRAACAASITGVFYSAQRARPNYGRV